MTALLRRRMVLETRSADETRRRRLFGGRAEIEPTGEAAAFHLRIASMNLDGIGLSVLSTTGHRMALGEAARVTLIVPFRGCVTVTDDLGALASAGEFILVPRSGRRRATVGPGTAGMIIQIPCARLLATEIGRCLPAWRLRGAVPTDRGPGAALARLAAYLAEECEAGRPGDAMPSATERAIATVLVDLVAEALAPTLPAALRRRLVQIARAEAHARTHAGRRIRPGELAAAAGTSPRSFVAALRTCRGHGPDRLVEIARLDAIRHRLARPAPDDTLTRIMLEFRVPRFGAFAADYRERFGEWPAIPRAGRPSRGTPQA